MKIKLWYARIRLWLYGEPIDHDGAQLKLQEIDRQVRRLSANVETLKRLTANAQESRYGF